MRLQQNLLRNFYWKFFGTSEINFPKVVIRFRYEMLVQRLFPGFWIMLRAIVLGSSSKLVAFNLHFFILTRILTSL